MVSPVGFGCWPIAGVSTLGVTDTHSLATIHAAIDAGINLFDTAHSYGFDGEADRLLSQVLRHRRTEIILSSKVGQYFDADRQRIVDGRPESLMAQAESVLQRLGVDYVDVMYLHLPDPKVPLAESAAAISEIVKRGWARYAGVSNVDAAQLEVFHRACPAIVVQPPYNMLQQQHVRNLRDVCERLNIGIVSYWTLMKGLLAGRLPRDHQFDPADKRLTYPVFQGDCWNRNQDFLDRLREMAKRLDCTIAQLVVAWTIHQPGITAALCGAKRATQITETAAGMTLHLDAESRQQLDAWATEYQVT